MIPSPFTIACFGICTLPITVAAQSAVRDSPVFPPGSTVQMLVNVEGLTEGPAATDGGVYFVELDVPSGGKIWYWDRALGRASVFARPSGLAAGLALDQTGALITAELAAGGGRRIGRRVPTTSLDETLIDHYEGRPIHGANDLVFDDKGRLYFTEYALLGPSDVLHRQGAGIYRLDPDGTAMRVIADAGVPNGIAISPDQSTLYVGSTRFDVIGNRAVLAYDLSPEGKALFRSVFVQFSQDQTPDGMTVDREGNLYVAMYTGRTGVVVYDKEGLEIGFLATDGPATNVAFGRGVDSNVLFITAGTGLYRVTTNRHGWHAAHLR